MGVWHSVPEFFRKASLTRLTDHHFQHRENVEHPCLMADEKGHFSCSILPWPPEPQTVAPDDSVVQSHLFPPQQSNTGFNPLPQVETISSLISLSFRYSLSDGQAAWAVMEDSQTGQRWLSGIIPLWNPPPPRKKSWRKEGQRVGAVPPQRRPQIVLVYSLLYLEKHTAGLLPWNWLCSMNAGGERRQMNEARVWMPPVFHPVRRYFLCALGIFYGFTKTVGGELNWSPLCVFKISVTNKPWWTRHFCLCHDRI